MKTPATPQEARGFSPGLCLFLFIQFLIQFMILAIVLAMFARQTAANGEDAYCASALATTEEARSGH